MQTSFKIPFKFNGDPVATAKVQGVEIERGNRRAEDDRPQHQKSRNQADSPQLLRLRI